MKLSPALLCRELSKLYPVATDGPLSVEPVLTRPQLLEPGAAPAEGALCVAPAGEDWSAAADRAIGDVHGAGLAALIEELWFGGPEARPSGADLGSPWAALEGKA